MSENEEFEFRARAEKEKASSKPGVTDELKAGGKAALENVGGAAGAWGGAELGASLGAMTGPLAPVAVPVGGLIGGIGGYYAGEKAQQAAGKAIPAETKAALGFSPEQRAKERKQMPTASMVGGLAPDVAVGGKALYDIGKFGITKGAELARSLKSPAPLAEAEGLDIVGEKGFNLLQGKADKLYQARKLEADQNYNRAFDVARQAQAKGEPFATSAPGRQLIADLEREKNVIAGGKKFAKGEEEVKGIDRLIKAIKGTTVGGETVPVGKGVVSSKMTKKTPSETTEKDIKALVEELRFLRDVDAKGKPYEAYAALDAKYKRDLIGKLENALYNWNGEYRAADEAYKAASKKLAPFQTNLMSGALKGEKFNPKDLVASPEEFGTKFFKDVDGVRQLKEVTQDPEQVRQLSKEYLASMFAEKTPAQIKQFASNPQNQGWMREAGILDDVRKYATQAVTADSRKNILKKLSYAAAGGTLGTALGVPLYHGTRKVLGL